MTVINTSSHGVYAYFSAQNMNVVLTNSLIVQTGGYGLWGQQYYSGALSCTNCDVWKNTGGTTYQ